MPKKKENIHSDDMPYIYERVVAKHGCRQFIKKLLRWVLWAALFGYAAGGSLLFMMRFRPEEPRVMSIANGNTANKENDMDEISKSSPLEVYNQTKDSFVMISVVYGAGGWTDDSSVVVGINETFGVIVAESLNKYYMLTSADMLVHAERISIEMQDYSVEATIESLNQVEDLAVLSIEKSDFPKGVPYQIAEFGNSEELNPGDTVIVAGSPYVFPGSVNYGHIIYVGTEECYDDSRKMLCTDMASSIDSHGVLLDQNGRIAAWILESQEDGLGGFICGVAIEELYLMIEQMIDGKEMAYLGVRGREITEAISKEYEIPEGLYITMIAEDSPAQQAGIQPGDFIISFNEESIRNSKDLNRLLTEMSVDDSVTVQLQRLVQDDYETMTVEAVLRKR